MPGFGWGLLPQFDDFFFNELVCKIAGNRNRSAMKAGNFHTKNVEKKIRQIEETIENQIQA